MHLLARYVQRRHRLPATHFFSTTATTAISRQNTHCTRAYPARLVALANAGWDPNVDSDEDIPPSFTRVAASLVT